MTTIKLRRGTASEWTTNNPILAAGEMGIETDTRKFKFGDGTTPWNTLAYASAEGGGVTIDDSTTATTSVWSSSKTNTEITTAVDTINSTKNDNIFDISKFTVVGNPNITDDGIASGFVNGSYVRVLSDFYLKDNWEVRVSFSFSSTGTGALFANPASRANMLFVDARRISFQFVFSGASRIEVLHSNKRLEPNTKYIARLKYNSTTGYTVDISTNGINWENHITLANTAKMATNSYNPNAWDLGVLAGSYTIFTDGSIDLKQFSITVDGEEVFNGLMSSTKPIYDKIASTNTALSKFQTDTDNNFSAVNSALGEKANLSDLALKQNILSDGNGTKIVDNKVDIYQGNAGIRGLNLYQNNGTITKNNDLSITFDNGACGYIYFPNKGVNNNYEVVLHCAYNGTRGSREDSDIHGIRVEPDTNFPNGNTFQGFSWVDTWSSPFRAIIVNKDSTQDYNTTIPTANYIKYTIIGTKIRQYYSTDGVDYTSITYNNNLDYVEISETGAYLNLCIANRNFPGDFNDCWTNTTLYSDSYVLDKSTNTYLMKQGVSNEGVAVATSNKYGLVLPDNSTIVSNNGVMSVVPSTIAGYVMPSNRYIDLTPGANGTSYIAPADGWIAFEKKLTATGQYVSLSNNTTGIATMGCNASDGSGGNTSCFIPCKKGDEVATWYSAGGDFLALKFIYAKGVQ